MRFNRYKFFSLLFVFVFLSVLGQNPLDDAKYKVQLEGVPTEVLQNVERRIVARRDLLKVEVTSQNIERFYADVSKEIKSGMEPFGYFKPEIHSVITQNHGVWKGNFYVRPGLRLKWTKVAIQINGLSPEKTANLKTRLHLKQGDWFNTENYNQAKQILYNVAAAQGYFTAQMKEHRIEVDLITYTASAILRFDFGPRFRFGPTAFSKNPFYDSFLRRFLTYQEGEFFSAQKLQQTQSHLAGSSYFSNVIVTPEIKKAKHLAVPIFIYLQPQVRTQYVLGGGFGTDTGVRALLGADVKWTNPKGHRFNATLRGSKINTELVGNYYIPGQRPAKDQYIFTAGYLKQNQITGTGQSVRGVASYQTTLWGGQQTISLTALQERYSLEDLPKTDANVLYPKWAWSRTRTRKQPSEQVSRIALQLMGASREVLSKTDFLQMRLDGFLLSTVFDGTRLVLRTVLGHTDIKNLVNLPLSLQLFAGGSQSIRGFQYNSIGPGRNIFVGSVEIQQRVKGRFYLAGFFDFGNVADKLTQTKLKEGVGPGLVWVTPVGSVELTIAQAISEPNKPWVIQFSMGVAF